MPDWHYHANHIEAPARGSKAAAMRDARRLHASYNDNWLIEPVLSAETVREHGVEFPQIVKCFRPDCTIRKEPI